MIYKIYLLNWKDENVLNKSNSVKRLLFGIDDNERINLSDYECSYEGIIDELDENIVLEKIWEIFNEFHPEDYTNRSLCVGDIALIGSEYYSCQMVGWKKLDNKKIII